MTMLPVCGRQSYSLTVGDRSEQPPDLPHQNGYSTQSVASKVVLPKGGDVQLLMRHLGPYPFPALMRRDRGRSGRA